MMNSAILNNIVKGNLPKLDEPIIFLDFDDVINVFGDYRNNSDVICENVVISTGTPRPGLASEVLQEDKIMEIAWRPAVVDVLRNMNCLWCTSWLHLTQSIVNPVLGVDFGYVEWAYRGFSDDGRYGKTNSIIEIIRTANTPFVVIDDSFWNWEDMFQYQLHNIPCKIIAPFIDEGLTLEQLNEAIAFVETHG